MKSKKRVALYKCLKCQKKFPSKLTYDLHLQRKHFNYAKARSIPKIEVTEIKHEELDIKTEDSEYDWNAVSLNNIVWNDEGECDLNGKDSPLKKENIFIKCDFCVRQVPGFLFQNHVSSVHKFRLCYLCKENIFSKIHTHVKSSELNPDYYKCCQCPKTFFSVTSFRNHLIIHSFCNYVCSFCETSFKLEEDFKKHLIGHEVSYQCKICNMKYRKNNLFREHLLEKHASTEYSKGLLPFMQMLHRLHLKISCAICLKVFQQRKDLPLHVLKDHAADIETLNNSTKHEINIFFKPTKDYKKLKNCPFCHEKQISGPGLKLHIQNEHSAQLEICKYCNRKFTTKWRLENHYNECSVSRCKSCLQIFKTHHALRLHKAQIPSGMNCNLNIRKPIVHKTFPSRRK